MKKFYKSLLFAAFMLIYGALSAQILSYDFEQLNVGDKIAETLGDPWTTWNNASGGDEDAVASDEHTEGTRSMKIDNGNDQVLKLGDKTTGAYTLSFDMYIPEGKEGYFNVLHEFQQTSPNNLNKWAFQMYFKSESYGNYVMGGSYYNTDIHRYPFDIPYDTWFNIEINVDIDGGYIIIKVNSNIICEIVQRFHHVYNNSLSAMNICPSNHTDLTKNGFYVDNITFNDWDEILHNIVPKDGNINYYIALNDIEQISYRIKNQGNTIGTFTAWIDFGVGEENGEVKSMHYDTDPYYTYGDFENAPYIEIGSLFYIDDLISFNSVGSKVTKMQYYLPTSYPTAAVGCEGPITFRIYNNQTYEILAEKVVNTYSGGEWLEVEFDESVPLTGFEILATVGFQQIEQGYPISMDQRMAMYTHKGDLIRLDSDSWLNWLSLAEYAQYYGQQNYGNHNIRLICEGEAVNASWGTLHYGDDIILPGYNRILEIEFDATNQEYGVYNASLVIATNNDENPVISIPIMLKITPESVVENSDIKYNLYPNPVKDIIHIDGEDLNCAVLYNSNGQIISIVEIIDNALNVNELENGVYYLSIINKNGESAIHKIIVSR